MEKKSDYDIIYTFNTRSNLFYHFIEEDKIKKEVWNANNQLKSLLTENVYKKISKTLIPSREKKEIALLFKTNSGFYGKEILNEILDIIFKFKLNTNILAGDFIHEEIMSKFIMKNSIKLEENEGIYIIYLNNLTENQYKKVVQEIKNKSLYLKCIDVTYTSKFKTYLSLILCWVCIASDKNVICCSFSFITDYNNFGVNFILLDDVNVSLFQPFLHYKIEQGDTKGLFNFSDDLKRTLKILSPNINFEKLKFSIKKEKFEYIKKEHNHGLKKLNLNNKKSKDIADFLNENFKNNYAFDFSICKNYGTLKFNVMYENNKTKTIVSFKIEKNTLYLITMY